MTGKKVTVFLVDGSEIGPRTIEIGNWSGKALYTPRSSAQEFLKRPEFDNCGIYILKSAPADNSSVEQIYIGEAEILRDRIKSHLKDTDKDFFTEIIGFTSNILTKAHIRFLESKLINEAKNAKSAQIHNYNTTTLPFLPEADISDMLYFLEQIRLILPITGFRFLIPIVIESQNVNNDKEEVPKSVEVFRIKHANLKAYMYEGNQGFIVKKGSQANKNTTPSIQPTYTNLRNKLIIDGILSEQDNYYIFNDDTVFSSISSAANIVLGRQSNGTVEWINDNGVTYKKRQEQIYN